MNSLLAISEANRIAYQAMVFIANSEVLLNANDIAENIHSSKHHVSKVLQRLVKSNLLNSTRGPKGGFSLKRDAKDIKLIEILEAIEGSVVINECAVNNDDCPFESCIMGNICQSINQDILDFLQKNSIEDISKINKKT